MSSELNKIKDLEKRIAFLESQLAYYENDGIGRLYYSLQRKANEMAELLNKTSLLSIDLDSKESKVFERLAKIWTDAGTISNSIRSLESLAGINQENKEEKQESIKNNKKPFSPENMADAVGELAGKKY